MLLLCRVRLHQGMEIELRETQSLYLLKCRHIGPGHTTQERRDVSKHAARTEQWSSPCYEESPAQRA